jgi:hypothetical protein
MDQCLKDLDDAEEYKTDQLAIQLVHIQRLTEKILHFHNGDSSVDEQLDSPGTSTIARIDAFRAELDSFRSAIPPILKTDCMVPNCLKMCCRRCFADMVREPRLSILLSQ